MDQEQKDALELIEHIKAIFDVSDSLVTLTLSILAGSLLMIASTSYRKPENNFKFTYLLFIPAWVFATISIYYANDIARHVPAAVLQKEGGSGRIDLLYEIMSDANSEYAQQINFFQISLGLMAVWLFCYLIWWVFYQQKTKPNEEN